MAASGPRPSYAKRRTLMTQGKAAFVSGDWEACARAFEAAYAWSEAGRCAAHTRDLDRAFDDLQRSLPRRRNVDQLRDDPDLAGLIHDPRWQQLLGDAAAQLTTYRGSINAELARLARADEPEDQAPRPPRLPNAADARLFAARIARVAEILAGNGATTAEDYYDAAIVYYRADTTADAARAHELALAALQRDPDSDEAKWLAAAAEDRRLKHEGKPQKYGTQVVVIGARHSLWNIDSSVSDAERERWSVPSLAQAIGDDADPGSAGSGTDPGSAGSAADPGSAGSAVDPVGPL